MGIGYAIGKLLAAHVNQSVVEHFTVAICALLRSVLCRECAELSLHAKGKRSPAFDNIVLMGASEYSTTRRLETSSLPNERYLALKSQQLIRPGAINSSPQESNKNPTRHEPAHLDPCCQ
jgi:hypothetical protein